MPRSLKKGFFANPKLVLKAAQSKSSGATKAIRTWSRDTTILPEFIGVRFEVHNGRKFIEVLVTEDMVGHKLGEFSPTTFFKAHGGKAAKAVKK